MPRSGKVKEKPRKSPKNARRPPAPAAVVSHGRPPLKTAEIADFPKKTFNA